MVEADDKNSVGRARRFEQTRYSVDGEVGLLGLLDLEKDPHFLALRPIDDLRNCRNARTGKSSIKAGSGVETADLLQPEVRDEAVTVSGAVERAVMKHDRLTLGGQYDVDLDRRRAPGLRRSE